METRVGIGGWSIEVQQSHDKEDLWVRVKS